MPSKITTNKKADAVYVYVQEGVKVAYSREVADNVIVDYDADDRIVGVAVTHAGVREASDGRGQ